MCRFPLRIASMLLLATSMVLGGIPQIKVGFAAAIPSGPVYVGTPVDLIASIKVTSPVDMDPKKLMALPGFSSKVTWTASSGTLFTPVGIGVAGSSTHSPNGIVFTNKTTYVPPTIPGTYTLTAFPAADPSQNLTLKVTVEELLMKLIPAAVTLNPGQVQQFGISFHGPNEAALHWFATGGAITSQGLYTAPATAGTYTISVRHPASDRQASALVTVADTGKAGIKPASVELVPWQSVQFQSTLGPAASIWSVIEPEGGIITENGIYTAPSKTGTYTVRVVNLSNLNERVTATIRVVPLTITIKPTELTLGANQFAQFYADVNGGGWVWSATGGSISDNGLYQAPMEIGSYQIIAQSTLDPTKRATTNVIVMMPTVISIVPDDIVVKPGQTCTFTTLGLPPGSQASWFVEPASAGTISDEGVFTAGNRPGVCSVMAVGEEMGASASVKIDNTRISPDPATVVPGGNLQFTAIGFPPDAQVSWTVKPATAGTISTSGMFTASSHSGQATVSASARDVEATVLVKTLAARVLPNPALVLPGGSVQFTCEVFEGSGPTVTWGLIGDQPGASIGPGGDYLAPNRQGIYHVSATTAKGSSSQSTVIVGPSSAYIVAPEIEVQESRTYQVRVRLKASNGQMIENHWVGELQQGFAYPEITFPAGAFRQILGVDGPYTIDRIIVAGYVGDEIVEFDRRENMGTTEAFSLAESWQDWIVIGDISDTRGLDQTGNGLIDKLVVTIPVEVVVDGEYRISANLATSDGKVIDGLTETQTWTRGTHSLSLAFDGRKIHASGVSGPLSITGLAIEGIVTRGKEFLNSIQGYEFRMFKP